MALNHFESLNDLMIFDASCCFSVIRCRLSLVSHRHLPGTSMRTVSAPGGTTDEKPLVLGDRIPSRHFKREQKRREEKRRDKKNKNIVY